MRLLLPALLLLAALLPLRAGPAPVTDPVQVAAHYRQVVARPEFQEPEGADVDLEMRNWLSEWFSRLGAKFAEFSYMKEMPRFASMILATMVAATILGLAYVAFRLVRRRHDSDYPAPAGQAMPTILRPPEFYEEELRRAAAAGDWRGAWLASWRQFLSRLERGRLVPADRSRTNREYLAELRTQPQTAPALALLDGAVDAYDRFIYGRRAIGEPDWQSFQRQLDEAGLLLHLTGRPGGTGARSA